MARRRTLRRGYIGTDPTTTDAPGEVSQETQVAQSQAATLRQLVSVALAGGIGGMVAGWKGAGAGVGLAAGLSVLIQELPYTNGQKHNAKKLAFVSGAGLATFTALHFND